MPDTVPRGFFQQQAETVAEQLLGRRLVHGDTIGRIVETEAYYGEDDPASHAYRGETDRNRVMFGPAGHAYVYICYGIHHMFNITTGEEGDPQAVLLRAAEPLADIQRMQERRGLDDEKTLCDGPGKLCEAFGIDKTHNNVDLTDGHLRIADGATVAGDRIRKGSRIGISEGTEHDWRFWIAEDPYVSR